ncbi:hypothetical protein SUGI_1083780 [Cryptomeria japonica]|nr:hypothetical protein SUGI_1083780 [Cryptomeria japonica]
MDRKGVIMVNEKGPCTGKGLEKKPTVDNQQSAEEHSSEVPTTVCFSKIPAKKIQFPQHQARVRLLIEEEETLKEQLEPVKAERLAKILMLTWKKKLNIVKFNDLRKYFELPDDYVLSIVPKYPELFRVSDYNARKNSLEIQLVSWNPSSVISVVERRAEQMIQKTGQKLMPMFEYRISEGDNSLQAEKFNKFQEAPYISPYFDCEDLEEGSEQHEKRTVGVIHELLSLTMWINKILQY